MPLATSMGMINRWIGIVTLGLMLSVNAALMSRDVLPDWFAGPPPKSLALHLQPGDEINVQLGLFDREGRRLGYAWTRSSRDEDLIKVRHKTVLEPLRLSHEVVTPMVCIETDLNYHGKASLDQLRVRVFGFGIQIRLEGEFYPPDHFPCKWQAGARRGEFDLPAETTRAFGDVIRPFDSLTGLTVGRSWRVKLLNPLAGIIPDWGPRHMMKDSLLVRVSGREPIEHRGVMLEAFVLEADRVRAWVGPNGQLLRQEFELPLIGRLILVDEPYDDQLRERVLLEARMKN